MITLAYSVPDPVRDSALPLVDDLLSDRRVRLSAEGVDRLLEFRARMAEGGDGGAVMRAYFRLAGVLSRESYLSYYRVRREVERRMRAVVTAPEWTDRKMRCVMRLERVKTMAGLEGILRRDYFEGAEEVIPMEGIVVRFEFA
ncbi:MAG: hypothetical protein AAF591_17445 [Verrucomicrobiota bacterium]